MNILELRLTEGYEKRYFISYPSPSPTPPIKGGATPYSLAPSWERAGVRGILE
jgi:hypothetical protein